MRMSMEYTNYQQNLDMSSTEKRFYLTKLRKCRLNK